MHKINPDDLQVVLWTIWNGLTPLAPAHLDYSMFDHNGQSGGSNHPYEPRSETYLFGVRMGWIESTPYDHVIYEPQTLKFAASQAIYNEIPN